MWPCILWTLYQSLNRNTTSLPHLQKEIDTAAIPSPIYMTAVTCPHQAKSKTFCVSIFFSLNGFSSVRCTEYWHNLLSVEYSFYVSCALRDFSRFEGIKITCTCVKVAGLHCLLSVVIDRQDWGLWMNL